MQAQQPDPTYPIQEPNTLPVVAQNSDLGTHRVRRGMAAHPPRGKATLPGRDASCLATARRTQPSASESVTRLCPAPPPTSLRLAHVLSVVAALLQLLFMVLDDRMQLLALNGQLGGQHKVKPHRLPAAAWWYWYLQGFHWHVFIVLHVQTPDSSSDSIGSLAPAQPPSLEGHTMFD